MAWKNKPTNLINNVRDDLSKVMRSKALCILRGVTITTPVDTGRLVGNWLVGLNNPNTNIVRSGSGEASRAISFSKGSKILSGYKGGDDIWISNNLPYAAIINNGDVNRPPRNMVEKALQACSR